MLSHLPVDEDHGGHKCSEDEVDKVEGDDLKLAAEVVHLAIEQDVVLGDVPEVGHHAEHKACHSKPDWGHVITIHLAPWLTYQSSVANLTLSVVIDHEDEVNKSRILHFIWKEMKS